MFRNFGFCSLSSSDAVVDDMDEIERVWVGVGVKIKKSGNVEITARGDQNIISRSVFWHGGRGGTHICPITIAAIR